MEPRHWACKPAYLVPVSSHDKVGGGVAAGRAPSVKMGGMFGGGSLIIPVGVAPIWMVSVYASVVLDCTIKSRRFLLAPAHLGKGP